MKQYQIRLNQLDKELNYSPLHKQVNIINNIIADLQQKKILPKSPSSLRFLPDSLDIIIDNIGDKDKVQEINSLPNNFRSFPSRGYGVWSLPNLETTRLIKQEHHTRSSLEIMTGNAYWLKALSQVGISAIASDSFSWAKSPTTGEASIFTTENLGTLSAIKKHPKVDLIIYSWAPNFREGDLKILDLCHSLDRQPVLLFISEKNGATNSAASWQKAESRTNAKVNRSFQGFDFIDERVFEIK